MRKVKQGLALLLTALMLVGCLPISVLAAQGDYTASYRVEKTSAAQYNGKDVAEFSFIVSTDNKPVGNVNFIVVAYDTSVFELLKKNGTEKMPGVTTDSFSTTIGRDVVVSVAEDFTKTAYACLSEDGKWGYFSPQPTLSGDGISMSGETVLMSVYFGLTEGASWDAIPTNAIRLVTPEEREMLNQSAIAVINDGENSEYIYGNSNGEDTLTEPKLEAVGYTPVKAAYTGTEASKPTMASKKGGDVTLAENAEISGESVEYGWSTSATVQPTSWQDEVAFNDLDVGTVYFWARVKETTDHKAGTAVVSDAVTVYAAPTISYADDALASLKVGQSVSARPTVNGGAPELTYSAEGLPAGLSINASSGVISGAPTTTTAAGGSATVTVTDAESQTGTATVTWGKVSGQSLSKENFTYTDITETYKAQPVTASVSYAGEITAAEAGTLTVYYVGTGETDYAETTTAPTNAGTYSVIAKTAGGTKYEPCEVTVGSLTINKATMTVTSITVDDKVYDGTAAAQITGVEADGKQGTDDVSVAYTTASASFNNANVGTNKAVTVTGLALAGSAAGNYTLGDYSEVTAEADITAAEYTSSLSETANQSVVVGVGTFTQPTFTGVNGEPVDGTLSYTYNTESKSYDEIVTALKALQKGDDATIEWSFTATNGNYVNTEKTGTINVTMVDIIFQVGNETAAADNALTIKQNPTYGDTWAEIVQLKENVIEASVNGDEVDGTYTLDVTGTDVPNANTHTVKVYFTATGSSQYQNVEVLSCQITVAKRTAELKWDGYQDLTYDGSEKTVTATVSNLVTGDECDVTVTGGAETNAGTYTATATGLTGKDAENYQLPTDSTAQKPYTIAPRKITFAVTLDPDSFEYDGSEKQPTTVTVKDGETELTTNDYTVTFPEDSINVNTYTVTVTGKNNYEGSTGSATYAITKQHQNDLNINVPTGTKTYGDAAFDITVSGGNGTGAVTLTSSDPTILKLEQGEGKWTATILKAGTVTLTANKAGDDNYEPADEKTVEVTIAQKSLEAAGIVVTLEKDSFVYTGEAFTPAVTVKDGDKTLVKDTDYEVAYTDNTAAGTAKVTVTGKGNYTESVEKTFTINEASLAEKTPTIVGEAKVGGVLTAKLDGVASSEYTWKWYRDNVEISGATAASYVVTSADSNKDITVKAVAKEVNYTGTTLSSEPVRVAKQAITGTVVITETNGSGTAGTIDAGDTLKAIATVTPGVSLIYQWYVDDVEAGTNSDTFTVPADSEESSITVTVTPASEDYEGSITSAAVVVGKTAITGTPDVDLPAGVTTPTVDTVLTVDVPDTLGEGDYTIQWLRDGEPIPGATEATYTVTAADKGHTISVKLIGAGDKTGEIVSAGTAVPATAPAAPTVTASAGNGQVTVSWTVSDNGGAPITGYTVRCGSDPAITLDAATTSYTFTGLTNDTEYTFTVTATNVTGTSTAGSADATPKAPTGGGSIGGGGGVTTYATTVEKTENGSVTVSPKNASKGATVTLTVTPDEGYMLDTITVTDKNGNAIEVTKTSDSKYTFKMPGSAVTVKATFAVKPDESTMPFTDVAESAWYYDAVVYVYEAGMMTGTNDGTTFSPAMSLSRSMMAQVLYNLEKGTAPATGSFTDVAADAWYADAVNWAAANGIVGGYGNGKFGPEDSITREQMALILYNYANFKGYDMTATTDLTSFSDDEKVSDWAEYAMKWAVAEGLINGSNNALNPLGTASRAEVAQILMNFGQNVAK